MFSKQIRAVALLAFALVVVVAATGCGSSDESSTTTGNATDSMFVNAMIPHHQSAVDMAELAQTRSQRDEIKALAKAIISAQTAEIDELGALQKELPSGSSSMMDSDQMDEMMNQAETLKDADDFDKAFIAAMVPHHQGAIAMAKRVLKGGASPRVKEMATGIIEAQESEIAQMNAWSQDWFGTNVAADSSNSNSPGSGGMMDSSGDHGGGM